MSPVPEDKAAAQAAALRAAAADNPELHRLLAEREMLVQRMQEIADRSPGAFAGHDRARYPVEPLGERRGRDSRWAQVRDESRSDSIRRILESRRGAASAETERWPELRERQRVRAMSDVRAEREAAEAETRALDARIEHARQDLLAERWAARPAEPGEDWHALRERQAAEALAQARARTEQAAAREQALERRIARDRSERPDDWSEQRERRRAAALELARRQAGEAAAAEQALDRRLARAREDRLRENRAAQDSGRAPHWVPPSGRRDPDPLPPEPARRLPPTAAERALDERIGRAREPEAPPARPRAASAERKPPPPEEIRPPPPPPKERETARMRRVRERDDADARFAARHRDRIRAAPAPAAPAIRERKVPEPVRRPTRLEPAFRSRPEPVLRARSEREVESFEQRRDRQREAATGERPAPGPDSLRPVGRELREIGTETIRPVDRVRRPDGGRPEPGLRTGREAPRTGEQRRDRGGLPLFAEPGGLGRLRAPGEPRPGRPPDPLFPLRERQRDLWPEKQTQKDTRTDDRDRSRDEAKEKARERSAKPRNPAVPVHDPDRRREQALERLKARREGERRDERRRELSLDRLASMRGRFGGLGR